VTGTEERLWGVVEPYVAAEGVELDDLEVVGSGPGAVVRVTVDGPEPVDVDHIAALSRGVSRLLDAEDPVSGSYTLEVTSPGLERKLRRPRHFEKSLGREIKVKTRHPVGEASQHRGVLSQVDEDGFLVDVDGEERRIAFDEVASARTVFVWEKAAKPGSRQ
jgi:ribosome maturation factor RimP